MNKEDLPDNKKEDTNKTIVKTGKQYRQDNYNFPNVLILLRFVLTIVLWILLSLIPMSIDKGQYFDILNGSIISYYLIASLFIFLLASFTDFLDGHLARKRNQITNFGKFFDPLADKILINSVLIFFAAYAYIPIWVAVVFITRDVLVSGLRMMLATKSKTLAANKYGKFKTLLQVLGLTIVFIIHPEPVSITNNSNAFFRYDYGSILQTGIIILYIGLGVSIYSGIKYYYDNWKYLED
ncbi:MAG: CDP-diacylglycerol--glycerol-3-phosphate 3-phosphatidyltransferase [Candidatus Hepatoplasma vulgare]|nr:MAG: CDP-diacylglycerol--glycerol-3-phosphate 3-phosphatidyltransferase [Candidatus Hepatoplasma sp.]